MGDPGARRAAAPGRRNHTKFDEQASRACRCSPRSRTSERPVTSPTIFRNELAHPCGAEPETEANGDRPCQRRDRQVRALRAPAAARPAPPIEGIDRIRGTVSPRFSGEARSGPHRLRVAGRQAADRASPSPRRNRPRRAASTAEARRKCLAARALPHCPLIERGWIRVVVRPLSFSATSNPAAPSRERRAATTRESEGSASSSIGWCPVERTAPRRKTRGRATNQPF